MPVAIGLGVASLAAGLAGSAASAAGQAATTEAGYQQAKINQQWQEFEKQMSLTQQRGAMGLQEFDRLFGNQTLERESLEQQIYGQRAYREQSQYNTSQMVRAARQATARQQGSMSSRGVGRGGTADAIQRQAENDMANDLARLRTNDMNQLAQFENQRNQMLKQRNMRPTNQPPTYIPATPVQQPDTSGMMMGALLGATAQGLGGLAGAFGGMQSSSSVTPGSAQSYGMVRAGTTAAMGAMPF